MPWVYRDQADFGRVNGAKGLARMLSPEEAGLARAQQRRYRRAQSPRIQDILRQAIEFKGRLAAAPGLTRDALAHEVGIDPSHLTRLLRLADLAPEIQGHILALPPTAGRGLLTERRLRAIARIADPGEQLHRFRQLLRTPLRAPASPLNFVHPQPQPCVARIGA